MTKMTHRTTRLKRLAISVIEKTDITLETRRRLLFVQQEPLEITLFLCAGMAFMLCIVIERMNISVQMY